MKFTLDTYPRNESILPILEIYDQALDQVFPQYKFEADPNNNCWTFERSPTLLAKATLKIFYRNNFWPSLEELYKTTFLQEAYWYFTKIYRWSPGHSLSSRTSPVSLRRIEKVLDEIKKYKVTVPGLIEKIRIDVRISLAEYPPTMHFLNKGSLPLTGVAVPELNASWDNNSLKWNSRA